jgi:hypothetical protein
VQLEQVVVVLRLAVRLAHQKVDQLVGQARVVRLADL